MYNYSLPDLFSVEFLGWTLWLCSTLYRTESEKSRSIRRKRRLTSDQPIVWLSFKYLANKEKLIFWINFYFIALICKMLLGNLAYGLSVCQYSMFSLQKLGKSQFLVKISEPFSTCELDVWFPLKLIVKILIWYWRRVCLFKMYNRC